MHTQTRATQDAFTGINISWFLHNKRFPWSCDQYFATQIAKDPREAYLKEIHYDSFHKLAFANINNHT